MITKIHRLRIWNPHSARVGEKWIIKNEVLIGSDKKCGIRVKNLNGIKARLDFNRQEILNLENGKNSRLIAGQIFQIDSFVFQWIEVPISKFINLSSIVSVSSIIIFLIGIGIWKSNKELSCSPEVVQISQGIWRKNFPSTLLLFERKQSFKMAIKDQLWLKARGELDSIRDIISEVKADSGCAISDAYHSLEIELSSRLIQNYLDEKSLLKAATELKRIIDLVGMDKASRLYRRVMKGSKQIYLMGYRLEDEKSEKAQQLMEEAESVCGILALDSRCFMQQTSHRKASLPDLPSRE